MNLNKFRILKMSSFIKQINKLNKFLEFSFIF